MIKDPGGHYTKQEVEEVWPWGRESWSAGWTWGWEAGAEDFPAPHDPQVIPGSRWEA